MAELDLAKWILTIVLFIASYKLTSYVIKRAKKHFKLKGLMMKIMPKDMQTIQVQAHVWSVGSTGFFVHVWLKTEQEVKERTVGIDYETVGGESWLKQKRSTMELLWAVLEQADPSRFED